MKQHYTLISNTVFAVNVLLLFFLLFEDQLVVPAWLQVIGRMHPLVLHLPIGLLILPLLLPLIRQQLGALAFLQVNLLVLALASLTAAAAALMGFLLACESGYGSELVDQHKWAGVGLSWMTYGLFVWLKHRRQPGRGFQLGLFANLLVLILTGHMGGEITHGEGFVLAPVKPAAPPVTEDTPVYEALIVPVLQQKCFSCHNESKAKGGLVMTEPKRFRQGGDNGRAYVPGDPENSLMIQRAILPLEHEEHMPPEGKPQLTASALQLLRDWIAGGADMEVPIRSLAADSPMKAAAAQLLAAAALPTANTYDFSPASRDLIEALNMPFRTVAPLANGSPALRAAIFVRQTYEPRFLEELLAVKEQLVELKLDHLPIQNNELSVIAQFRQLEKLNLNNTDLTADQLDPLGKCKNLRSLSLSSTAIDTGIAIVLRQLPNLEELFVWNTALDTLEIEALEGAFPQLEINRGYLPEAGELLRLSPPVVKRVENVAGEEEIHLQHNFPGARIRYTTDGTEPDSIHSPLYAGPIKPDRYVLIKSRAFLDGWLGSDEANVTYFPRSLPIREAGLLTQPNQRYQGSGAAGLIDRRKGFPGNFLSPFWIGFREEPFAALFFPEDPSVAVTAITLSYLQNIGSYIMTPALVEVWGGADPQHLQLLKRFRPPLPDRYQPTEVKGLDIALPPSTYSCYKIVAHPIAALPPWHQGKGERAWVFLDEVYFYSKVSSALVPEESLSFNRSRE